MKPPHCMKSRANENWFTAANQFERMNRAPPTDTNCLLVRSSPPALLSRRKTTAPRSLTYISRRSYHLFSPRNARFAPHVTPNPAPSVFLQFSFSQPNSKHIDDGRAQSSDQGETNKQPRARTRCIARVCVVHSLWFDAEASLRAACSLLWRDRICAGAARDAL